MEMNLVTIKEYAKKKHITYEAVRKQIQKFKDDELKDHIIRKNKTQYLDEYAVAFLDNKRRESPVTLLQIDRDEMIEQLEDQVKQLLVENAKQANRISELAEWKAENALLIAGAEHTRLMLEEKASRAAQEAAEANQRANTLEKENKALQAEFEAYKKRPLWKRIFE